MYAIIETGGKQIRVEEGAVIFVEKIEAAEGETVVFDKVVACGGDSMKIGTPYVEGAKVNAVVEKQGKAKKVIVFKYEPKKHYHKKQGHRQPYTKLTIEAINA